MVTGFFSLGGRPRPRLTATGLGGGVGSLLSASNCISSSSGRLILSCAVPRDGKYMNRFCLFRIHYLFPPLTISDLRPRFFGCTAAASLAAGVVSVFTTTTTGGGVGGSLYCCLRGARCSGAAFALFIVLH